MKTIKELPDQQILPTSRSNINNTGSTVKSDRMARSIHFRHSYQLLVNKVCLYNNVSLNCFSSVVARTNNFKSQCTYHFGEVINVTIVETYQGTSTKIDDNQVIVKFIDLQKGNLQLSSVKFDMSKQKVTRPQSKKFFQKQFIGKNGYIQYKFISLKSQKIQKGAFEYQLAKRNEIMLTYSKTHDSELQKILKEKDEVIRKLQEEVSNLIVQAKKIKRSISKQKQKTSQNVNPLARRLSAFGSKKSLKSINSLEDLGSLNFNVKVVSSQAKKRQIQQLKKIQADYHQTLKQNQDLKSANEELMVQNKLLQQTVTELKYKNQKSIQNRFNEVSNSLKQMSNSNLMKDSQVLQRRKKFRNTLQVDDPIGEQKSIIKEFKSMNTLDMKTINMLDKLDEQINLLKSKLAIKTQESQRYVQQLDKSVVQVKKITTQLNNQKALTKKYKQIALSVGLDLDNPKGIDLNRPLVQSHSFQDFGSNKKSGHYKYEVQRLKKEMTDSIIQYKQKIEEKQMELVKVKIMQKTSKRQKQLYQNKYYNIMETLEDQQAHYMETVEKGKELEAAKEGYDKLQLFTKQLADKYSKQCQLRQNLAQREKKYKAKLDEVKSNWENIKIIEGQYQANKKKIINYERTVGKFQLKIREMENFLMKIQSTFYSITKKTKKVEEGDMNEEDALKQLEDVGNKLAHCQQQFFQQIISNLQQERDGIQGQFTKKLTFQLSLIDELEQIDEQQKQQLKKAKQYEILQQKKSKKKKVQDKLKNYQIIKQSKQQERKAKNMNINDRIRLIQNRVKDIQSLIENIGGNKSSSKAQIEKIAIPLRRENKQLREKNNNLQTQLQKFKQIAANPMFASVIRGNHIQNMSGFQSVLLPQNQAKNSMLFTQKMTQGNAQVRNTENSMLSNIDSVSQQMIGSQIVDQQYKKKYLEMTQKNRNQDLELKRTSFLQGRQNNPFMRAYEDTKKNNLQLQRKKSQLQIQNQNFRYREEKLVLKHQQRERQMQRVAKASGEQLIRQRDRALQKIQKYEKDVTVLKKNNTQMSTAMELIIKELTLVSDMLEEKEKTLLLIEDENALVKERLFNYEIAEQEMIQEIQKIKKQSQSNEQNLNKLFEERNLSFLKIEKIKSVQIEKLQKMVKEQEYNIDKQLMQFLSIKNKNQELTAYIKNLQSSNYELQTNQQLLQDKLKQLRENSTQQILKLQDQNDFLKKNLIELAQNMKIIEIQLAQARLLIESLEKQNEVLQPTYNEMCQMELKFQSQKTKYQDIIGSQNQKFVILQQKYQNLLQKVEQVQQQNKNLQIRQLNFQTIKGELNQKIFQKDRQILKIEQQKNIILLRIEKMQQQIQQMKEQKEQKQHIIQSQKQEIQNILKKLNSRHRSRLSDQIEKSINRSRLGDDLNNNNSSRRLRLSRSSRNRTSIQQQGVDGSRRQLKVSTSRNLRESQSRSPYRKNQTLKSSSFRSCSPSKSPLLSRNNFGLESVAQSPDDLKGTILMQQSKKTITQNSQVNIVVDICQSQQLDNFGKPIQKKQSQKQLQGIKQYEIDQIQQSRYYNTNEDAMYQNNENNFSLQDSQADILYELDKTQLVDRVIQLKDQLKNVYDENDKLLNQLKKNGITFNNEQNIPTIEIHQGIRNSRQNQGQQSSSIEYIHNIGQSRPKSQNIGQDQPNVLNIQSQNESSPSKSNTSIKKKQSIGMIGQSQSAFKNFIDQEKYNQLKQKLIEKDLEFEQTLEQLRKTKKQLDSEKDNVKNLLQECSQLMKQCEGIQKDMIQKNQTIQILNDILQKERKQFQDKCAKLIVQNLDKDKTLMELSKKLDYLQQKTQKLLNKLSQNQQEIKQKNIQIKQSKSKIKKMITNYQQYEQQSQLQILQLKQSIDSLIEQKQQLKDQQRILAQKYVELQCEKQKIQMGILQKNQQINKGKSKSDQVVNKYNEIIFKYQKTQKNRQQLLQKSYLLQIQLKKKQDQIQQLHRNNNLYTKKLNIKLSTQKEELQKAKSKIKQKDQHLLNVKHEIALYNDECGQLKKINQQLNFELNKVQRQLKDIMNQYETEFQNISHGAGKYSVQVQKLTQIIQQKDKEYEQKKKVLKQKQTQIFIQKQKIIQLQETLKNQRTKSQKKIQELSQKYEIKNDQFQKFKLLHKQEITFKEEDFKKLNQEEITKQKNISNLKQKIDEKEQTIQKLNIEIKRLNNQQLQSQQQQKAKIQMLNSHIQHITKQMNNLNQPNSSLEKQYHIYQAKSRLQKSQLKSQLDKYGTQVQKLQKQNFYLKKQSEAMGRTLMEIKQLYLKNERKLKNSINELQEQVQFYKAKRIDEMNKLLNQTDD